jgi:hypothetical protein
MQYCLVTFLHLQKDSTTPVSTGAVDWLIGKFDWGSTVRSWVPGEYESYVRILHPAYTITGEGISTRHVQVPWSAVGEWSGKAVNAHSHIRDLMYRSDGHWWREIGDQPDQGRLERAALSCLLEHLAKETRSLNEIWMLTWNGFGGLADIAELPIEVSEPLTSSGRKYVLRKGSIEKSNDEPEISVYENVPSFWWPPDRSWFASCDIDGSSTYVGGSMQLIDAILSDLSLEAFLVELDDPFEGLFVENPVSEYENETVPWTFRLRHLRFGLIHRFGGKQWSSSSLYKRRRWWS